jgi:hypothetical protein
MLPHQSVTLTTHRHADLRASAPQRASRLRRRADLDAVTPPAATPPAVAVTAPPATAPAPPTGSVLRPSWFTRLRGRGRMATRPTGC